MIVVIHEDRIPVMITAACRRICIRCIRRTRNITPRSGRGQGMRGKEMIPVNNLVFQRKIDPDGGGGFFHRRSSRTEEGYQSVEEPGLIPTRTK